jgi:hypothetical protein
MRMFVAKLLLKVILLVVKVKLVFELVRDKRVALEPIKDILLGDNVKREFDPMRAMFPGVRVKDAFNPAKDMLEELMRN